ncbi:glycosyltransferase [Metabacillus indicus]|uniref:glycosyltransferase n=1 Tax=Metabacillus indicus TaxID=246786 RepID=UPI003CF1EB7C
MEIIHEKGTGISLVRKRSGLYASWHIDEQDQRIVSTLFGQAFSSLGKKTRIFRQAKGFFAYKDIELQKEWHAFIPYSGTEAIYFADIVLYDQSRELTLARSDSVHGETGSGSSSDWRSAYSQTNWKRCFSGYTSYGDVPDEKEPVMFQNINTNMQNVEEIQSTLHKLHASVLMISTEYPPNLIGGLGRHVHILVQALAEKKKTVILLTAAADPALQGYENPAPFLHIFRLKPLHKTSNSLEEWVLNMNFAFVQFLKRNRGLSFDLVHVHDWLTAGAGRSVREVWGVPLAATIHATEIGRNGPACTPLQKHITMEEKRLVKESDRVIVCSQYMKKQAEDQLEMVPGKSAVIYNGINPLKSNMNDKNSKNKKPLFLSGEPYIFAAGRLVPEKGFGVLLAAMPEILKRFPEIRLIIAGDGPYRSEYEKLAKELNVQNHVIFLGFLDDAPLHIFFKNCEMTVVPSLYEPFGMISLESMAACKLTIASDTGGLKEIIRHRENGLLFERGNSEALTSAILEALTNKIWADRLAKEGLSDVSRRFSYDLFAEQVIEEYEVLNSIKTRS